LEGDIVATVEDESADGGKQQPLCHPVRKRARSAVQEDEEDKEDSEEEEEDNAKATAPARPGQPQKLPRYIILCSFYYFGLSSCHFLLSGQAILRIIIPWLGQPSIYIVFVYWVCLSLNCLVFIIVECSFLVSR
jgi:hypothetical protein